MASFVFRHQPFKTLYLFYVGLSLILVKLPYWALINALPSWRPRPSWPLTHVLMINLRRVFLTTSFHTSLDFFTFDVERVKRSGLSEEYGLVWVDPTPELIVGEIKAMATVNGIVAVRVAGYWYGERDTDGRAGQPAGPDEKVIYELHGGGWVLGSATPKWESSHMCDEMLRYADGYSRLFEIDYRLAQGAPHPPTGAFPAALVDAIAGYNYLVNDRGFKPSNILVSGESGGGDLAFALVRYLVQAHIPSLPPPKAQFLLSPAADWGYTHAGPQSTMVRYSNSDYVHEFFTGYCIRALLGNLPADDAYTNSWISPGSYHLPTVKGRFAGLPPTLIMAGDAEMMLDCIETMRDRIVEDCGEEIVTYIELPDATHTVLTLKWHEPERTRALEQFAQWVRMINEKT